MFHEAIPRLSQQGIVKLHEHAVHESGRATLRIKHIQQLEIELSHEAYDITEPISVVKPLHH